MNIAVTGGDGVFAKALRAFLPDAHYLSRTDCNVAAPAAVASAFARSLPEVVVHTAAITDHACADAAALIAVNVEGTRRVAQWCRAYGARLVYLSTHYVYPGDIGGYREWDATKPIGAYAASKLAGEAWAETAPESLIVRGSWYDYESRLRHWIARGALTDAWVSREHVRDAARKVANLVRAGVSGTYNIGGPRRTFAQILEDEGYTGFLVRTREEFDGIWLGSKTSYSFPRDVSVNTERYDALAKSLEWEAP